MSGGHNRTDGDIWDAIARGDVSGVGDSIRPRFGTHDGQGNLITSTLSEQLYTVTPILRAESPMEKKPGYHLNTHIPRGTYGEITKIQEELLELEDAEHQGNKIMALVELSDLYGAIEGYLKHHHPDVTMRDLATMSNATQRAFANGERVKK